MKQIYGDTKTSESLLIKLVSTHALDLWPNELINISLLN